MPKAFNALSLKATKLHSALKNIKKCLHYIVNIRTPFLPPDIQILNTYLQKAVTLAEIEIESLSLKAFSAIPIPNTTLTIYTKTLQDLKQLKNTI